MVGQWYVARTRPRAERRARDSSIRKGVEAFLPCVHVPNSRSQGRPTPLFPGYLFLRYDFKRHGQGALREVPEVLGLVSFAGVAPCVPDDVVAELARRVDLINANGGLWTRFRPGDSVWVHLAAEDRLAEVVESTKSPRDRVRVLMHFLGGLVRAEVPWHNVRPAASQETKPTRPPRRTRGGGRRIKRPGMPDLVAA